MSKRNVLITGATSGIGEATARLLAKNNYNLVLCGRRRDKLEKLRSDSLVKPIVLRWLSTCATWKRLKIQLRV